MKDDNDNLWKLSATMVKPDCPSYLYEIDIECINGSFNAVRHQLICNNITVNLSTVGLGPINSIDCIPASFTGFIGLESSDPNDPSVIAFYNCIGQQCICTENCDPVPEPPIIPIPGFVNAVQDIVFNNGSLNKKTAIIESFEILDITTQTIATLTSCDDPTTTSFNPINISIGPPTEVSCYDTINIVRDVIFTKDYLVVVKHNIKILSINNPISDVVISDIISCTGTIIADTQSSDVSISSNNCNDYPNNEDIVLVTDIYIENNTLKYKTANIKVPQIITANNISTIIQSTNCSI